MILLNSWEASDTKSDTVKIAREWRISLKALQTSRGLSRQVVFEWPITFSSAVVVAEELACIEASVGVFGYLRKFSGRELRLIGYCAHLFGHGSPVPRILGCQFPRFFVAGYHARDSNSEATGPTSRPSCKWAALAPSFPETEIPLPLLC